ncbi:MAG: MATE family efflux transporter [Oscillospiraceae bacterium]
MKNKLSKFIGTKDFYRATIAIAIPIMLQSFVTSFVNLIDNVMIGSVGAVALTAVTVANKYYMVFNAALLGLTGGGSIFISQFYGANAKKKCQEVFNIILGISLLVGLIFMGIIWIFPESIIHIFSNTPEIVTSALGYVKYIRYSYIPFAISMTVMMSLRAVGINTVQLKVGILAVLTNTFLNYLLIYGTWGCPELGVEGAAIATLVARLVEATIYVVILLRKKYFFRLDFLGIFKINWTLFKSMMIKATPLTVNEILFSVGQTIVFTSYMRVSEHLVAAISVADTVVNIAFIIFSGLSSAVAILIGNRLGAGEIQEAKENATKLIVFGVGIGVVISVILFIVAAFIPMAFHFDGEINKTITEILRIRSFMLPIYVVNVCSFFTLRAGGDTLSTLIMDSGMLWGLMVVVSVLLSTFTSLPLTTVYFIVESCEAIKMFVAVFFVKKGRWARNLTVHP